MILKVGIWGASGKMGLEVASLLAAGFSTEREGKTYHFELADAVSQNAKYTSVEGIEVRTPSEPAREPVHVWVDFSRPEGTLNLLQSSKAPVVVATTGFSPDQLEHVKVAAARIPVLYSANFSPGMGWIQNWLRHGEKHPFADSPDTRVFLEEIHHRHKKDAPSGTAKALLDSLRARGREEVQTYALRAGDVIGVHELKWIADGEEVTITHRVTDRKIFARGALLGAAFLATQKTPRLYSFDEAV